MHPQRKTRPASGRIRPALPKSEQAPRPDAGGTDRRLAQAFFAPAFHLEFLPIGKAPQMIEEQAPVAQEGAPSQVAADAMKQFNRAAAPLSEQTLDHGRSTTGTSNVSNIAMISGMRNNPWVLAGIRPTSLP